MDEPRYMKRKILAGAIDVDETENAIIVHYEVEATVLGDLGEAMQVERKAHKKRIRLKQLTEHSNIERLAEDIVEKCSLIHPSKLPLVERLVYHLQQRQLAQDSRRERRGSSSASGGGGGGGGGGSSRRREREEQRQREQQQQQQQEQRDEDAVQAMPKVEAKMDDVETYLEKLYDDATVDKIEGTSMLLQLAHYAGNLEDLVSNERLMGALSRVLGDEYRKSSELAFNIVRIFWSFSNFIQMHAILGTYRVGAMTMNVLEWELRRHEHRVAELQEARRAREDKGEYAFEDKAEKAEREEREKRANRAFVLKQDRLLHVCISVLLNLAEDHHVERKMVKRSLVQHLCQVLTRSNVDLLLLTTKFLKKLSIFGDNKTEMGSLDVVTKVVRFVPCGSEPLIHMALRLLFNLSFDSALRESMVSNSLIPKLVELLKRPPFRAQTLRLLYHLSIDDRCKSMFTFSDAIPIIMQLVIHFPKDRIAAELVALAINLSLNGRSAEMMCQGHGLRLLVERVIRTRDSLLAKVVRNLSQWTLGVQNELGQQRAQVREQRQQTRAEARAARKREREESGGGGGGGKRGEHKGSDTDDDDFSSDEDSEDDLDDDYGVPYLQKGLWAPHVEPLLELALGTENHDLLVELLGALGNLTPADLPRDRNWAALCEEHGILPFLHKLLVPGFAQDDVVLEVIILLGTLSLDPEAAPIIASSRLIMTFQLLLHDKAEDSEILLQLLFTFYRLLLQRETRNEVLYMSQQIVGFVVECMGARNKAVRAAANQFLDVVVDQDRSVQADDESGMAQEQYEYGTLANTVRRRRFELHNAEWLEAALAEERADRYAEDDLLDEDDEDDARFREAKRWQDARNAQRGIGGGGGGYSDEEEDDGGPAGGIAEWSRRHGTNVALDMDMLDVDGAQWEADESAGGWGDDRHGPVGAGGRYWE